MALRLPDVGAPDVRAVIPDEDRERAAKARVGEGAAELRYQLGLARRVVDHRHAMDVAVGQPPNALEHLELGDRQVIAVRSEVPGQQRRQ